MFRVPHFARRCCLRLSARGIKFDASKNSKIATFEFPMKRDGIVDRNELRIRRASQLSHWFFRPSRYLQLRDDVHEPMVVVDQDKFKIVMNLRMFNPEQIRVRVIDEFVEISGSHEDSKGDYEWISRQFVQRYAIPRQCDATKIKTSLSPDGVLKVTIPKRDDEHDRERIIPIEREQKANSERITEGETKKEEFTEGRKSTGEGKTSEHRQEGS